MSCTSVFFTHLFSKIFIKRAIMKFQLFAFVITFIGLLFGKKTSIILSEKLIILWLMNSGWFILVGVPSIYSEMDKIQHTGQSKEPEDYVSMKSSNQVVMTAKLKEMLVGWILSILAGFFQGIKDIYEERVFDIYYTPFSRFIAIKGMFGLLFSCNVMIVLSFFVCPSTTICNVRIHRFLLFIMF